MGPHTLTPVSCQSATANSRSLAAANNRTRPSVHAYTRRGVWELRTPTEDKNFKGKLIKTHNVNLCMPVFFCLATFSVINDDFACFIPQPIFDPKMRLLARLRQGRERRRNLTPPQSEILRTLAYLKATHCTWRNRKLCFNLVSLPLGILMSHLCTRLSAARRAIQKRTAGAQAAVESSIGAQF